MYYPSLFAGVRPFEPLRDRIDNPLDLSVRPSEFKPTVRPDVPAYGKLGMGPLSSQQLAPQMPLLDSMYAYKPFIADPQSCSMGGAALMSPYLASPFCSLAPSVPGISHLGLIPGLLHQNRDTPSFTPFPIDASTLPYHMRIGNTTATAIALNSPSYFGHNSMGSVVSAHLGNSYGPPIPHFPLYSDFLTDINRRPIEPQKDVFGATEPTTLFSEHLQRLRDHNVHQNKCSAPCCMPSSTHPPNGCNCCNGNSNHSTSVGPNIPDLLASKQFYKPTNADDIVNSVATVNSVHNVNNVNNVQTVNIVDTDNSAYIVNNVDTGSSANSNSIDTGNRVQTVNSVETVNSVQTVNTEERVEIANSVDTAKHLERANSLDTDNCVVALNSVDIVDTDKCVDIDIGNNLKDNYNTKCNKDSNESIDVKITSEVNTQSNKRLIESLEIKQEMNFSQKKVKSDKSNEKSNEKVPHNIKCKPKGVVSVRRRRFRSGLDMIRPTNRRKKARSQYIQASNKRLTGDVLAAGEEVHKSKSQVNACLEVKRLKNHQLSVNKALGETLLHRAARSNRIDVVKCCLQSNTCDVNAKDNANYTPLHECCTRGNLEIATLLLQNGAEVNASATGGIRPLHDAIENNHIEVVRLLLSYGADPNISTYSGATPLQLARSKHMTAFIAGFLDDIAGDKQKSTEPLMWKWSQSAYISDKLLGFNVLDGLPLDDKQLPDFLFEESDCPYDQTYRLYNSSKELNNLMRLSDVVKRTGFTRDKWLKTYSNVDIVSVQRRELTKSTIGQSVPEWPTDSNNTEDMIVLDDNVRRMLGIETFRLA